MNILPISVTNQAGGFTLSLRPLIYKELREMFPEADALPSIFVSRTARQDFAALRSRLIEHLVPALTGLAPEQLDRLSQILFVDAVSGALLAEYESKAAA